MFSTLALTGRFTIDAEYDCGLRIGDWRLRIIPKLHQSYSCRADDLMNQVLAL